MTSADQAARPARQARPWLRDALLAVLPVAAAAVLAALVTRAGMGSWYADLAKPAWTPPRAAFGPAWTVLYCLMAYAGFRLLRATPRPARLRALIAFGIQLALNAAWSPIFFGLQAPQPALLVMSSLIVAIVATGLLAAKVDRAAAWCFAPYLVWVIYATSLNTAIVVLNPI